MSKREFIAATIFPAVYAHCQHINRKADCCYPYEPEDIADEAVEMADFLLKALEK